MKSLNPMPDSSTVLIIQDFLVKLSVAQSNRVRIPIQITDFFK